MQGMAPILKQICVACPNIALEEGSLQLACISPVPSVQNASRESRASAAATFAQTCGAVFNLMSGERRCSLALG